MESNRPRIRAADIDNAEFDIVIVGAGAAGSILAARLSEKPALKIALVEAGADLPPGQEHRDILDPLPIAYGVPGRSWSGLTAGITVQSRTAPDRRTKRFIQGRGIGGGSAINGSFAFRGQPEDYDGWAAAGAVGWAWQDVLPYFCKLETDLDIRNHLHGSDGPIKIRREVRSAWSPFSQYLAEELRQKGHRWLDDYNGQFDDGYAAPPMANLPDRRIPTSTAYLTAKVRQRPNLTIIPQTEMQELIFEGRRVTGVRARLPDGAARIFGREVILSCGGIFTPALLQRSGIGRADYLRELGIEVRSDLPGVGEGLKNHPKIDIAFHLPNASRQRADIRSIGQVCARLSSGRPGCMPHDMGLMAINRTTWHALGRQIGALMLALYQPKSTGHVRITGTGGLTSDIEIDFALLDHDDDFLRMRDGLALALRLLAKAQAQRVINTVFMPNQRLVAKLQHHNAANAVAADIIRRMFASSMIRKLALGPGIIEPGALAQSPDGLERMIRAHTNLSHHVCGTCRMGEDGDPDAVLTPDCRVRGIDGLRVVDASIFPDIPRAGMFVPVMMAAEKMADQIGTDMR
ncbi:GMC family oxidoreductase [Paracoccus thiocyanatus]|uniref:Glucose-methanol-choline oxidoreductase N-terminal domain-containing protein n=1 Tax=Paracoccus thiocyanatus TaxID=34006 RepID=A0A3D8PA04_9RHOB|nr:GMC family oxidoreductase [Paracoccus thiocyanatus]RDW12906.1 hypothetical protein DIE28_11100 [Paracoccus thiocyanatus]